MAYRPLVSTAFILCGAASPILAQETPAKADRLIERTVPPELVERGLDPASNFRMGWSGTPMGRGQG